METSWYVFLHKSSNVIGSPVSASDSASFRFAALAARQTPLAVPEHTPVTEPANGESTGRSTGSTAEVMSDNEDDKKQAETSDEEDQAKKSSDTASANGSSSANDGSRSARGKSSKSKKSGDKKKKKRRGKSPAPQETRQPEQPAQLEEEEEYVSDTEDDKSKQIMAVQKNRDEFLAGVTDNYNGTYTVTYTPTFDAEYLIHVTVDSIPIAGSPFQIKVEPGSCFPKASVVFGLGMLILINIV
jgi:hypothetical protein